MGTNVRKWDSPGTLSLMPMGSCILKDSEGWGKQSGEEAVLHTVSPALHNGSKYIDSRDQAQNMQDRTK